MAGQQSPGKAYIPISADLRQTALLHQSVLGGKAWQQAGTIPVNEDWADIFGNYYAQNINQSDTVGGQSYDFASRMENHVMQGPR